MISPDPVTLVLASLGTVELGYKVHRAKDEVKNSAAVLDNFSKTLAHVRLSLKLLAAHLPNEHNLRIESIISRAESELSNARRSLARNNKRKIMKNLLWVLGDREDAQMHRDLISQHPTELVIELLLAILRKLSVLSGNNSFHSARIWLPYSPMLQIGNKVRTEDLGMFRRLDSLPLNN